MAGDNGITTGASGLTPQEAPTNIGKFLLNWQNKIEIATDGLDNVNDITKAAWARLAAGINNLTPA